MNVISNINGKKIVGTFYEKELKKTNQDFKVEFKVEKVIKRKDDKLYNKWKGYDHSFNSWIDKNISLYRISYFPEPHTHSKIKIEADTQQMLIHQNLLKILI